MKTSAIALASALVGGMALSAAALAQTGPAAAAGVQVREVLRRGQGRQERLPDRHRPPAPARRSATRRRTPGSTCRPAPATSSSAAASSRRPVLDADDRPGATIMAASAASESRQRAGHRLPIPALRRDRRHPSGRRLFSKSTPRTTWAAARAAAAGNACGPTGRSASARRRSVARQRRGPRRATISSGFAALCERIEPMLVSEHLAWSVAGGVYLNDLLPLPYTEESLADRRRQRRARAGPAEPAGADREPVGLSALRAIRRLTEAEFLAELVRRTGCGLLFDVNNVYVTCAQPRRRAARPGSRRCRRTRSARSIWPATASTTTTASAS